MQQLERAEAQRDPDGLVEIVERPVAVRRKRPVQLELPAQRPVGQLRRQRHLARLEGARLPQRGIERQVGERPSLRDAHEDLPRDAPRGRHHGALLSCADDVPGIRLAKAG